MRRPQGWKGVRELKEGHCGWNVDNKHETTRNKAKEVGTHQMFTEYINMCINQWGVAVKSSKLSFYMKILGFQKSQWIAECLKKGKWDQNSKLP